MIGSDVSPQNTEDAVMFSELLVLLSSPSSASFSSSSRTDSLPCPFLQNVLAMPAIGERYDDGRDASIRAPQYLFARFETHPSSHRYDVIATILAAIVIKPVFPAPTMQSLRRKVPRAAEPR